MALITSFLVTVGLAQDEAFLKEVEAHMRRISDSDEGLADRGELDRLQKAMREGGDWDGALLRLIDPNKYDRKVIGPAIGVLQFRGSFGRPEFQAAVIKYFNARVKAARAHDRSDPLFKPVVRTGIGGLSSGFAESGGPELLLAVLDFATSTEERADPFLDEYTWATIAEALLEKGDSRHLEGIRKLLAVTKSEAIKEKLERAIARVDSESEAAKNHPPARGDDSAFRAPTTNQMEAPPIAQSPASAVEQRTPVWPWVVGIFALMAICAVVLKRRT